MTYSRTLPAILLAAALSACGGAPSGETPEPVASATEPSTSTPPTTLAPPPPLVPEAEKGETGARAVLLDWARALELERFEEAWAMLGDADQEKWPMAKFVEMFADLDRITVAVPGGEMDGGAGSLYYTSQATVTATDEAGRPVRFEGPVTLRRVNDVDGATPDQLRWHIERVQLDWTH